MIRFALSQPDLGLTLTLVYSWNISQNEIPLFHRELQALVQSEQIRLHYVLTGAPSSAQAVFDAIGECTSVTFGRMDLQVSLSSATMLRDWDLWL